MASSDLKSVDWLATSTKQLIAAIDPSVSVEIASDGASSLQISINGISEDTISKLQFLTNTDYNNNILYLADFSVYISGNISPLNVAGLNNIAISLYNQSDLTTFVGGIKVKQPFADSNIKNNANPPASSFNELIDQLTSIIPYTKSTVEVTKTYAIILIAGQGNNNDK